MSILTQVIKNQQAALVQAQADVTAGQAKLVDLQNAMLNCQQRLDKVQTDLAAANAELPQQQNQGNAQITFDEGTTQHLARLRETLQGSKTTGRYKRRRMAKLRTDANASPAARP